MTYRPLFFDLYLPFRYNKILQTGDYNGFIFIIYRFFGLGLICLASFKRQNHTLSCFYIGQCFCRCIAYDNGC